jgi:aspartate racemase
MKKIGLIGGLSWQSTLEYYRIMNVAVAERTEGKHAAKILLESLDFGEVEECINNDDFIRLAAMIVNSAQTLERAGAAMILIGANTMHMLAPQVQAAITVPLVHIADATIEKILEKGLDKVILLGTKFTMEHDFLVHKFVEKGIDILLPEQDDREFIQKVIFTELFRAYRNPESKTRFLRIIDDLAKQGGQGVILGCTELPILLQQSDCTIPVFDTTELHALAAVEAAMRM